MKITEESCGSYVPLVFCLKTVALILIVFIVLYTFVISVLIRNPSAGRVLLRRRNRRL